MRVVLVIGTGRLGGAEGQIVRLAAGLSRVGHDVRVLFLTSGGPLTTTLDDAGVPYVVLTTSRVSSSTGRALLSYLALARELRRFRPDVVHAWLAGTIWIALPLAALVTRATRIAAFRGHVAESTLRFRQRAFRSALKHAHGITVNSPTLIPEVTRWGGDPDRIHFVANGVDIPTVASDPAVDPPTAVVVANFRDYKGHDVLLSAVAKVENPVRVRLCGDGDQRFEYERQIKEAGLEDVMVVVPEPADIPAELAAAQFAIHPSRAEGMSNAILEQIASGLPVVGTDVGAISMQVDDGVSGLIVPAGDASSLASAIDRMAADPELRRSMGEQARQHGRTFSWAACVESYVDLYARLGDER